MMSDLPEPPGIEGCDHCELPAAERRKVGCVHEHVGTVHVCRGHSTEPLHCVECLRPPDPHRCLLVTP